MKWAEIDERIWAQKSKATWVQLGDRNNSYFHAILKDRSRVNGAVRIHDESGKLVTEFEDIENETLRFYKELVGNESGRSRGINIQAMRRGKQFTEEQQRDLIRPVNVEEIRLALNQMGYHKAPGVDGYSEIL